MNELAGLGRLVAKDERDLKHLLPRRAREAAGVEQRFWYLPPSIDQGQTSSCVGHGWTHWQMAGPVTNKTIMSALKLYEECQKVDEWPGEDYEGTSVRAGAKILKQYGIIESYKWAFDAETIINHLLTTGPCTVGTSWFEGMANPNARTGTMDLSGADYGGHCYLLGGATRRLGKVRCLNSYGRSWADKGRSWLRFEDLDKLIKADGEACVAIEIKNASR